MYPVLRYRAFLSALAVLFFILHEASAAQLNFTVDTPISLSSPAITFTVLAGSAADGFTVATGSVVVTSAPGAPFTLTSASRNLTVTGASANAAINQGCNDGGIAKVIVSGQNTDVQTLTIAPAASQCSVSAGGGAIIIDGGGGGGSGGGAASASPPSSAFPVVLPTAPPASVSDSAFSPSGKLDPAQFEAQIKELQKWLIQLLIQFREMLRTQAVSRGL